VGKSAVGFVAGFVTSIAVIVVVEMGGHMVFPHVSQIHDAHDMIANLPLGALIAIVFGWALGPFAGGYVASTISRDVRPALAVGFCMTMAGVLTMLHLPHPAWMWIFGILIPIPAAWFGSRLVPGSRSAPPAAA
jgi:hypothetical protein